jgi:hypothetical protein
MLEAVVMAVAAVAAAVLLEVVAAAVLLKVVAAVVVMAVVRFRDFEISGRRSAPRRSRGQTQATRGVNDPPQGQLACLVLLPVC